MVQETRGLLSVQYRYDEAGNRTRITWPDGTYVDYDYDELDRLIVANENGTTPLATYGYDDLSRRKSKLFHNNLETTYGYAVNDNLQSLGHGLQGGSQDVAFTYGYNGVSERISLDVSNAATFYRPQQGAIDVYSPNALNQYATVNAQAYVYDGNGNLTDDGVNVYGYDSESRLTSFVSASVAASYRYDALDRRIEKTVEGAITVFLHAGAEEIAEYDSSGNLLRRFVPGAGFGEIIATVEASGVRFFHHEDGLGSTVARSNDAGWITEINAYGPFGEGPHGGNAFGFTGQRFDAESGLYYFRARYYSPALGRFLQPDPAGFVDGMNLYLYVLNDPVNNTDPTGLICVPCVTAAIGAGVGAGIEIFKIVEAGGDVLSRDGLAQVAKGAAIGAIAGATGAAAGAGAGTVGSGIIARIGARTALRSAAPRALQGAGVGAVGGATAAGTQNALTQAVDTGSVDLGQVGRSAAFGAVTGALGGAAAGHIQADAARRIFGNPRAQAIFRNQPGVGIGTITGETATSLANVALDGGIGK